MFDENREMSFRTHVCYTTTKAFTGCACFPTAFASVACSAFLIFFGIYSGSSKASIKVHTEMFFRC